MRINISKQEMLFSCVALFLYSGNRVAHVVSLSGRESAAYVLDLNVIIIPKYVLLC